MKLWSNNFQNGCKIPEEFAFGKHHPETHIQLSDNHNPHLAWSDLPEGTSSLVLIVCDPDVPSKPDDVNQEGKTVPASLPRTDFYHWALVDLAPNISSIEAGQFSDRVTPGGKQDFMALRQQTTLLAKLTKEEYSRIKFANKSHQLFLFLVFV